jgi:hypothetical protein
MHWAKRRLAGVPVAMIETGVKPSALVNRPHPTRKVEIVRYGPRQLDKDGLYSSVKPCLDLLKSKVMSGVRVSGYFYDDSPTFIDLEVKQEKGEYGVTVRIYA